MYVEHKGLMLILSSPSGAGKTTIAKRLLELEPKLHLSVSVTTRKMRDTEVDGRDYFFITPEQYQVMKDKDDLLESDEIYGNCYGSPKKQTFDILSKGEDVLYDINWYGAQQLMLGYRADTVSVFILPPSLEVLEQRLRGRAQDSEEAIAKRMSSAKFEISKKEHYDYLVINDSIEDSVYKIRSILTAERLKQARYKIL